MFFTKKKKEAGAAFDAETPRAPRYTSLAMVSINGFEGQAVLRNVSIGGFCMESKTFADMDVSAVYTIRIDPETSAGISRFELTVELRWILSSPEKFSVGFKTVRGSNRLFEQYVGFLKEQHRRQAS
ncbi:MAG: PilZ domain-containing protein [Spirochaetaceae bacterium]|nr:PilZ domain-containing protein [Spirochaetaceae bacterium]